MTTTHTPGPWTYYGTAGDHDFGIYAESQAEKGDLALVRNFHGANARLIAAAPDLLAALETIVNSEPMDGDSFVCDFYTLQSVAREAIRKARGNV